MAEIQRLPDSVRLQYTELMQQCIHPAPHGANISFKSKLIAGKRYWYIYISLGARRSEHYLGEETTELLDKIDEQRTLWEATEDDRKTRQRLVAMLLAGGATATPDNEGKVLSLIERSGLFLAGGVVVGTLAFRAYANMLGVIWHSELQTRDIDLASDYKYPIVIPRSKKPIDLSRLLPELIHDNDKWQNDRAEVSHQPTRQRERQMRRFKSPGQAQRFLSAHGPFNNVFRCGRHLMRAARFRLFLDRALDQWREVTCVQNAG